MDKISLIYVHGTFTQITVLIIGGLYLDSETGLSFALLIYVVD